MVPALDVAGEVAAAADLDPARALAGAIAAHLKRLPPRGEVGVAGSDPSAGQ